MIAGAVATVGLTGSVYGVQAVSAETNDASKSGSSIVDKIASKFNLNKTDVQAVFDEDRQTHEAEHQAKMEERLSQAVKEGKLTEEQKTKILAKLKELKANRPDKSEMQDKTPEEMKEFMEQHRKDLEQWAEDNDIPSEYFPMMSMGHRRGHGSGGVGFKFGICGGR